MHNTARASQRVDGRHRAAKNSRVDSAGYFLNERNDITCSNPQNFKFRTGQDETHSVVCAKVIFVSLVRYEVTVFQGTVALLFSKETCFNALKLDASTKK